MTKKQFWLIPILSSCMASLSAFAQLDIVKSLLSQIMDILNMSVTIPRPTVLNKAAIAGASGSVKLWLILGTFALLYSIIYPASGKIPLFKDSEAAKSRKVFTIAFALIAMFVYPTAESVASIVSGTTGIAMVLAFFLGIYFVWSIFWGGASEINKDMAKAGVVNAEAGKLKEEARKQQLENEERKLGRLRKPLRRLARLEFGKLELEKIENQIAGLLSGRGLSAKQRLNKKEDLLKDLDNTRKLSERMGEWVVYIQNTVKELKEKDVIEKIQPLVQQSEAADKEIQDSLWSVKVATEQDDYNTALENIRRARIAQRVSEQRFLLLKSMTHDLTKYVKEEEG